MRSPGLGGMRSTVTIAERSDLRDVLKAKSTPMQIIAPDGSGGHFPPSRAPRPSRSASMIAPWSNRPHSPTLRRSAKSAARQSGFSRTASRIRWRVHLLGHSSGPSGVPSVVTRIRTGV